MRFRFRLAVALGKTIEEIYRLSSMEMAYWKAYYQLEPFGADRDNFHSAQIAALTFNVNRGKTQKAVGVEQFMYRDREGAEDEKRRDLARRFLALGSAG